MNRAHEPPWLIRSYRDQREVEPVPSVGDLGEGWADGEGGVDGVVGRVGGGGESRVAGVASEPELQRGGPGR